MTIFFFCFKAKKKWNPAAAIQEKGPALSTIRAIKSRGRNALVSRRASGPIVPMEMQYPATSILDLLKGIRAEHGLSFLSITHALAVLRQICDRVYVLYRGDIIEQVETGSAMDNPRHAYTRRLIDAIPSG